MPRASAARARWPCAAGPTARERVPRGQQLPDVAADGRRAARSTRSKRWRAMGGSRRCSRRMAAAGGSQCGYCTPGFVMSLFAEHYRPGRVGPCDPLALAGNLCRCTGYRPIRDAARVARARLRRMPSANDCEQPGPVRFDDLAPRRLLAPHDRRRVRGAAARRSRRHARGRRHRSRRRAQPAARALAASGQRRGHRRAARVRATRRSACASARRCRSPRSAAAGPTRRTPSREWLTLFASPLIRNRATLGGNLATASPIGDGAPLLLALDASVHVAGAASGTRGADAAAVVVLHRLPEDGAAARRDDRRPSRSRSRCRRSLRFYKVTKRRLDDISTVAAAMSRSTRPAGVVARARVRLRRRGRDTGPRRARPKRRSRDSPGTLAAVDARAGRPRPRADAALRSPRLTRVSARGVEQPGREVLVGVAAVSAHERSAGRCRRPARERARRM